MVSGNDATQVMTVAAGVAATVSGITVENGADSPEGAGIANRGDLTVTGTTFSGDQASPSGNGGAIANAGTLTVQDSTFTDDSTGNDGGAIDNADKLYAGTGTLSVSASTFTGDAAADGGAIDNGELGGDGSVSVTGSTFSDDTAADNGGGIANGIGGNGTVSVTDSTFADDVAEEGGAIGNADLRESAGHGTVTLVASTLWADGHAPDNASGGEALYAGAAAPSGDGSVTLAATILGGSDTQGVECFGTGFVDDGYDLSDDSSCALTGTGSVSGSTTLDGSLGSLGANGGPTPTIVPGTSGPAAGAIPAGTQLDGVAVCPREDQRGVPSQGACTIGAVEATEAGSYFVPYWWHSGVGCSGAPSPGLSDWGPAGCGTSTTGLGTLAYNYLAGSESGNPGSSFTYAWVVPPGYEDRVTFAIPPGGYLDNGAGSVVLDGRADGSTKGGARSGKECTKSGPCTLWKSAELASGPHR